MLLRDPNMSMAAMIGIVLLSPNVAMEVASAEDLEWVGYQNDCQAGNPSIGSFFHGDNWLGFLPPGPGDRAIFSTEFWNTPPIGYPRTVHFGDFCFQPVTCSPVYLPADTASFLDFEIRDDDWIFDFGPGVWGIGSCEVREKPLGSLALSGWWLVGTNPSLAANVSVMNGTLSMDGLHVGGYGGEGHLTLRGGIRMDLASGLRVGEGGTGSLVVTGDDTALRKSDCCDSGFGVNGDGTVEVSDGAVLELEDGNHHVGRGGNATGHLVVESGGQCSTTHTWILGSEGANPWGSVLVDGAGSLFSAGERIQVGKFADGLGTGSLLVRNDGRVTSKVLEIGWASTGEGRVEITSGGTIGTNDGIHIGRQGNGSMMITDTGELTDSAGVWIGEYAGSTGDLTVEGIGSQATVIGGVFVGDRSVGSLSILHGAEFTGDHGKIGVNLTGHGAVLVDGSGSLFQTAGSLDIGPVGAGSVMISDQAGVTAGTDVHVGGSAAPSSGVLELDHAALGANTVYIHPTGVIRGCGVIAGDVVNEGRLERLDLEDDCCVEIDGDFSTVSIAHLRIADAPHKPKIRPSKICVTGVANLDGSLRLVPDEAGEYAPDDSIPLIRYGSYSAARGGNPGFDCVSGTTLGDSLQLELVYSDSVLVAVAVTSPSNQLPIAVRDSTYTVSEVPVAIDVLANDVEPDGQEMRLIDIVTPPLHGVVTILDERTVEYVPEGGLSGVDSLTYAVTDCMGGEASAVLIVASNPTSNVPDHTVGSNGGAARLFVSVPNPFRITTEIRWTLDHRGAVDLSMFDVGGRRIRSLVHGDFPVGSHTAGWDGRDDEGKEVPSGIFFARLQFDGDSIVQRIVVRK